jgi:hypothetical protein
VIAKAQEIGNIDEDRETIMTTSNPSHLGEHTPCVKPTDVDEMIILMQKSVLVAWKTDTQNVSEAPDMIEMPIPGGETMTTVRVTHDGEEAATDETKAIHQIVVIVLVIVIVSETATETEIETETLMLATVTATGIGIEIEIIADTTLTGTWIIEIAAVIATGTETEIVTVTEWTRRARRRHLTSTTLVGTTSKDRNTTRLLHPSSPT